MDGEVMTALHQKLLLRELAQNGFPQAVYLPETGQIKVPVDEREHQPLLTANGSVLYWPEHRDIAMGTLRPIGERVKETVDAWNRTREMPVPDLAEFRVLAEYSNIVLAARDDTKSGYGLHFVTWEYNAERTGMYRGNYTEDYSSAKEDFALRAGLIAKDKVFTREQATVLLETVEARSADDFYVSFDTARMLKELSGQLREAYLQMPTEKPAPTPIQVLAQDLDAMMRHFGEYGHEDDTDYTPTIASALTNGGEFLDRIEDFLDLAVAEDFEGAERMAQRFYNLVPDSLLGEPREMAEPAADEPQPPAEQPDDANPLEIKMSEEEFKRNMLALLPDADIDAIQSIINYAHCLEDDKICPANWHLGATCIEFVLVKRHYEPEIAHRLLEVAKENALNSFEFRGAANYLRDGLGPSEIKDKADDGLCNRTPEEVEESAVVCIAFADGALDFSSQRQTTVHDTPTRAEPTTQALMEQPIRRESGEVEMSEEEFKRSMNTLLPGADADAIQNIINYVCCLEDEETCAKDWRLGQTFVEFVLVERHYEPEIARNLLELSKEYALNASEIRGAANYLRDGLEPSEIKSKADDGLCDRTPEEIWESILAYREFVNETLAFPGKQQPAVRDTPAHTENKPHTLEELFREACKQVEAQDTQKHSPSCDSREER